jgi:hypothetical protein
MGAGGEGKRLNGARETRPIPRGARLPLDSCFLRVSVGNKAVKGVSGNGLPCPGLSPALSVISVVRQFFRLLRLASHV